jgi:signal transduction histidine kinase
MGTLVGYLIRTAARHAPGRGLITIRTWLDGSHACVCVADNGQGPAGDLSAAQRVVEMHGGQVEIEPTKTGFAVHVRLPIVSTASIH